MSYTKQVQPGAKVTVNASKTGYTPNSIIIDSMPSQNITRQIFLTRNGVAVKVIYGPNTENPGEEVLIYDGIIQPTNNSQLLVNGNSVQEIHVDDDKFPSFNTQGDSFYVMVGVNNWARLFPMNGGGELYYCKTMPRNINQNIVNNSELDIILYKAIVGLITFTFNGNSHTNPTVFGYKLKDFYCSEISDYIGDYAKLMGLVNDSIVPNKYSYMIGYTYTFVLEDPQGNTVTYNVPINPSQQQLADELFDIIINLDD